jgi:hypothetical protein
MISDLPKISREKIVLLGTLNFLSSRFISFIIPVKKKRFTDFFLRFLDFPNKSVKML